MAYFPFMMELEGRKGLIVGGGHIALHKLRVLSGFGASLHVVAPQIREEIRGMEYVQCYDRCFEETDLEGMDFVVAATADRALNYYVSDCCRRRGIPVNAVDMKEACSFIFPAMIRKDDVLVAISTGGNSPAAAAWLKQQIAAGIPPYFGQLVDELGRCREEILTRVPDEGQRKEIFQRLLERGIETEGVVTPEDIENAIAQVQQSAEREADR